MSASRSKIRLEGEEEQDDVRSWAKLNGRKPAKICLFPVTCQTTIVQEN